ncbi:MAG: GNAT family N-acetyltransferase [Rheinheimera sp.]
MTQHFDIANSEVSAATMSSFVCHGTNYQCLAEWPVVSKLQWQKLTTGQGWPWHHQLAWFLELAEFEQNQGVQSREQFSLLRIYKHQQLVAILPLRGSIDGYSFAALTNYYSPEFAPLVLPGITKQQLWPLIFAAMSTLWPQWRQISLRPLSLETATVFTQQSLPKLNVLSAIFGQNWRATASNQADYWQKRPSQLVNTLNRKRKKLQQLHAEIQIYQKLTPELLNAYWHIYQRSWKQPEPSTAFIDWLLAHSSDQGQLRLGMIYIDKQPVAFQFWLVQQGQAAIVKLAQDQAFDSLSPGTVLMAAMIDEVMTTDGVTEIDFLTGNDQYKAQWMDQCLPLLQLDIINCQHFPGRLLHAKLKIRTQLSQLKNKVLQRLCVGKVTATVARTGAAND